jgi:outer membrane protein assembly factor BamA
LGLAGALLSGFLLLTLPQAGGQNAPPPAPPPAPAPQAAGQATQGVVEEVRFEGSKRLGEDALRLQVRTQKGKPYSAKTVDDDIKALAKLQFIASSPPPERLPDCASSSTSTTSRRCGGSSSSATRSSRRRTCARRSASRRTA